MASTPPPNYAMNNRMTTCWIITEKGLKGTENQCTALAHAAGLTYTLKQIRLKNSWKWFTPWLRFFSPEALTPDSDNLDGPFPDLVIASGRKAIAPALWVKRQSGGRTKLVIVQSPVIKDRHFDLVIALRHDNYHAANTLPITGALSLITPQSLASARATWAETLGQMPGPRIAVLIGGTSRTHKITPQIARLLVMQLRKLAQQPASLMITASRRTPMAIQEQIRSGLNIPHLHFYDGTGPNPYQAYLAWSDAILVTEDSVSMASEAISTGKPVYIIRLQGRSARFKRFHDHLIAMGYAKWFTGQINHWTYVPPDDLGRAALAVKNLLT